MTPKVTPSAALSPATPSPGYTVGAAGENGGHNGARTLEETGFCAAIYKNGETASRESKNIADFNAIVKDASVAWIDTIVEDLEKGSLAAAKSLGFSEATVKNLIRSIWSNNYEDFGNEMGILLPAMRVEGFDVQHVPLIILIKENLLVTMHTIETKRFFRVRRYAETLLKKIPKASPQNDKMTLLLCRIIEENNARNFEHLREIEQLGDKMSKDLSDTTGTSREQIGPQIYQMKHALIEYLSGLWATVDALNSLRYGDADLLTDDQRILDRIGGLVSEVHAQIGLAEHLSEVLASGLEVLQSIYNNQLQILNNRLAMLVAYLTILGTAVLVPNTLATVFGNAMFGFTAADQGWYISLMVGSTIVATVAAWFFVKKMGWLPKSPH